MLQRFMRYTKTVMRVVEPRHFKQLPKRRGRPAALIVVILVVIAGIAGFLVLGSRHSLEKSKQQEKIAAPSVSNTAEPKTGVLKQLSGEQFLALYRSVLPTYPNTQQFADPPPITGNMEADQRIRSMAEARGYHLTRIPVQAIVKIDEPLLENDNLLQPLAAQSWAEIKAAAHKDGYPLTLISAYRSPEYQRNLFMQRLLAHGVTAIQVAAAQADPAIEDTLHLTAVPGYSRHHTGYTVDMWCDDHSGSFLSSSCYQWISANNYEHAKQYGWIPSYPSGASEQGPEPEPWEYVWVGRDRLVN
jgi:LAS superfamily LD-carboxypeptidase LdcB